MYCVHFPFQAQGRPSIDNITSHPRVKQEQSVAVAMAADIPAQQQAAGHPALKRKASDLQAPSQQLPSTQRYII